MPPSSDREQRRRLQALRVHQWLPDWDEVDFDPKQYRAQPPQDFYLFTLPAAQLRALCGIFRRSVDEGLARSRDLGIQRRHDEGRSLKIHEFVEHGFPWSALSEQRRKSGEFDDLKKPGWLPTAIVVNILKRDDTRNGRSVHAQIRFELPTKIGSWQNYIFPQGLMAPHGNQLSGPARSDRWSAPALGLQ